MRLPSKNLLILIFILFIVSVFVRWKLQFFRVFLVPHLANVWWLKRRKASLVLTLDAPNGSLIIDAFVQIDLLSAGVWEFFTSSDYIDLVWLRMMVCLFELVHLNQAFVWVDLHFGRLFADNISFWGVNHWFLLIARPIHLVDSIFPMIFIHVGCITSFHRSLWWHFTGN